METVVFEPMSVGRIFDRAFAIYRNNFLRFITIVAIIEVPLALLSTATDSWTRTSAPARPRTGYERALSSPEARPPATRYDSGSRPPVFSSCLGSLLGLLLQMVGSMLCQAALIKSISEIYLGREIMLGQAYRYILPKFLTLVGATLVVAFVTGLGLILFIVPGIIFGLWFSLTTSAIIVEGRSATDGMSRSKALVAGNLGKVFAVGFLAGLLFYPIFLPLTYLAGWIGRQMPGDTVMLVSFLKHLAATLSSILVTPVSAAAFILLYYDLRIRKEGFDLQMLAQSMASEQGEVRAS